MSKLESVIDIAIAEIAKAETKALNGVSLKGLENLKRAHCELKDNAFVCTATAEGVAQKNEKDQKVLIKVPITALLKGDLSFDKFVLGEVEAEEIEEEGLFSFWKKVKNAVSKAGKVVGTVAKDAAKVAGQAAQQALNDKAAGLATKAVGAIIG